MSSLQSLSRRALPVLLALGAAVSVLPAQAGGVQWSVGVNLPMPGVVVYQAPPQVVYAPAPVYAQPQRVYVQPQRGYASPPEVVYLRAPQEPRWQHRHHHRDWRDEYGGEYRRDDRGDGRYGR